MEESDDGEYLDDSSDGVFDQQFSDEEDLEEDEDFKDAEFDDDVEDFEDAIFDDDEGDEDFEAAMIDDEAVEVSSDDSENLSTKLNKICDVIVSRR